VPSRREGPPDPLGKRALFWVPGAAAQSGSGDSGGTSGAATVPLPDGKHALYSRAFPDRHDDVSNAGGSVAGRGTVKVECQRCSQVSSVGLYDLLKSQLPLGIWLPRGRFDRRMRCPACHTRSWCSVTLRRS
jgi:hypothetical protein